MPTETYLRVKEERGAKTLIKKHIETKGTCLHIAELASSVILDYKGFEDPTLNEVAEAIKKMKFWVHK